MNAPRPRRRPGWLAPVLLAAVSLLGPSVQAQSALVGLDHVPLAVGDLDLAATTFRRHGFALKPGRPHDDGIRNTQLKFVDGSGLELITASARTDALSARYVDHLASGDGPAFLALHARETSRLTAALVAARIGFERDGEAITFRDPRLGYLFIVRDNRSPSDRPEHFAHPNGAVAMSEVWIATDDQAPLRALLEAVGAAGRTQTVEAPTAVTAQVFELEGGRLVLLPASRQLVRGRPVVGVVMEVRLAAGPALPDDAATRRILPPEATHGLWLVLRDGR